MKRETFEKLEQAASGDAFPGPYSSNFGEIRDGTGRVITSITHKVLGDSRAINATAILFARSFLVVRAARQLLKAMRQGDRYDINASMASLEDALRGAPDCPLVKEAKQVPEMEAVEPLDEPPTEPTTQDDTTDARLEEEEIPF